MYLNAPTVCKCTRQGQCHSDLIFLYHSLSLSSSPVNQSTVIYLNVTYSSKRNYSSVITLPEQVTHVTKVNSAVAKIFGLVWMQAYIYVSLNFALAEMITTQTVTIKLVLNFSTLSNNLSCLVISDTSHSVPSLSVKNVVCCTSNPTQL